MGKLLDFAAKKLTGQPANSSLLPFSDLGSFGGSNPIGDFAKKASDIATDVADVAGDLTQMAKMAYCIGQAITNPSMMLGILDQIGGMLFATAFDIADRILSAMKGQIDQMLSQITGTALNVIKTAFGFLNAVVDFGEAIANLIDTIANLSFGNLDFKVSQEECEFMFAAIAACMLNQLFGSKLKEFENEVIGKINEVGSDINGKITESLASTNATANFVQQQTFMMNKATAQINGINSIISN